MVISMNKVVGVRFKPGAKVYDFDCGVFVLKRGDPVIVETEQGLGFGIVAFSPAPSEDRPSQKPLKKIYRPATEKDFQQRQENLEMEHTAHAYCLLCIKQLGLKMNLFSVESAFDARKLTFFFTSEGRVDFRQLVKLLVSKFGVKIEMKQVGIRNQAKMCGGIGRCGREICCSAFMEKFGPVSIRMAKEQNLSLNPTKISGQCGRLMCCLTFENETYKELKENFPKVGKTVSTPRGKGKVVRQDIIGNKVGILLEDGVEVEAPLSEITETG